MTKIKLFKCILLALAVLHTLLFIFLESSNIFRDRKTRRVQLARINEYNFNTTLSEDKRNTTDTILKSTIANKRTDLDMKDYINKTNIERHLKQKFTPSHSNIKWCDGKFISISHNMAYMKNVVIDRTKIIPSAKGGEKINETMDQSEASEYYKFQYGAFNIHCNKSDKTGNFIFEPKNLQNWYKCLRITPMVIKSDMTINGLTYVMERVDYAHLYFMLMDLYDAFLVIKMFNHTFGDTNLLLLDAHPRGHMDNLFEKLFKNVYRLKQFKNSTQFEHMIWGFPVDKSPLLVKNLKERLYLNQFTQTILSQVSQNSGRVRSCQKLNILFVWRHNYVAHPRNKKGVIGRKITNENELLSKTRQTFPHHHIRGVQLDALDISDQLTIISNTDVLIGMHGAALAYSIFLPQGSSVIELFPSVTDNWHFEYFTKWNKCIYESWHNNNKTLFDSDGTSMTVPVHIVQSMLRNAVTKMCKVKNSKDMRKTEENLSPLTMRLGSK